MSHHEQSGSPAPQVLPPPDLSVVIPCFNEQEVIEVTYGRLTAVLQSTGTSYELIFVDDGSRDATYALLAGIHARDPQAKVIAFSRNFGHQVAVTAGIDHAQGRAVVLIDADLQDPPELIPAMIDKWRQGFEVVYGRRNRRAGESAFKLTTAKAFYRIINSLAQVEIPIDTGDFRLMDRKVVEALRAMPERDRFVRGLVSWVGFRQCAVMYDRDKRFAGVTKYPLKKMVRFAVDAILSFSTKPLQWTSIVGLIACGFAGTGIVYALALRMFTDIWVSGWTLMFVSLLFIGGLQLITLGIVGEYVGRIYMEAKRRPLYIVAQRLGFAGVGSVVGAPPAPTMAARLSEVG